MEKRVSSNEWQLVRWLETLLTPLIIAAILGGLAFYVQMSAATAQTQQRLSDLEESRVEAKNEMAAMKTKQEKIVTQTHSIEVTVERVETNQRHFSSEIDDIKKQNTEILRLLRERR